MRTWFLLAFGAAFLASAWAANHGSDDYDEGYRYGEKRAEERCQQTVTVNVSALNACGHNQRSFDFDPSETEFTRGCVDGYTRKLTECSHTGSELSTRVVKPVSAGSHPAGTASAAPPDGDAGSSAGTIR